MGRVLASAIIWMSLLIILIIFLVRLQFAVYPHDRSCSRRIVSFVVKRIVYRSLMSLSIIYSWLGHVRTRVPGVRRSGCHGRMVVTITVVTIHP